MFLLPRGSLLGRFQNFHRIFIFNNNFNVKYTNLHQIRSFSHNSDSTSTCFSKIRSNLSNLQQDLSFLLSSNIKSECQLLELKLRDSSNLTLKNKSSHMAKKAGELEKLVYKILDNRLRYNNAKNFKVTKESNYKYGIVGVSLICVFGSLSLSLHPLFLIGCGVGLYLYRVVYRQSRSRKVTNLDLETLISENRINKQRLSFLIKLLMYQLTSLEKDFSHYNHFLPGLALSKNKDIVHNDTETNNNG